MPTPRFVTQTGEIIPRHRTSLHHVFWEAKLYQTSREQLFRNLGGLVLPLQNTYHNKTDNALHANVEPPPKPSEGLMKKVIEFNHSEYRFTDYDEFYRIAHFIGDIANSSHSPRVADEAFAIHENLMQQSEYIELGRVEPHGI
jgi:hypothetical protein